MNEQKKQLTISNIPVSMSADTCHISVNNVTKEAGLLFIQVSPFMTDAYNVVGTPVANVRLSYEVLCDLKEAIDKSLAQLHRLDDENRAENDN